MTRGELSADLCEAMAIISDECLSHAFCDCCPFGNDENECYLKKNEPFKWSFFRVIVPEKFGGFVPMEGKIEPQKDEEEGEQDAGRAD